MQQHMLINGTLCHSVCFSGLNAEIKRVGKSYSSKDNRFKRQYTLPNKQNEVLSGYLHIKNIENFNIIYLKYVVKPKRHSNLKSVFSPEMNTPEDLTRVCKLYVSCAMIRRKHHLLTLTGHGTYLSDEVRDRD